MIPEGTVGEGKIMVTEEMTAAKMGSGTLPVLATPAMILLIEKTSSESIRPFLQEGESTVGTLSDVVHKSPSVVGTEIFCKTTVVAVDGPRIAFAADIWDSVGEVGSGWHERFIVNNEKFMKKAAAKSEVR